MKLSEFKNLLHTHPDKPFRLAIADTDSVPSCFHITEAAHIVKTFIDCGGQVHTSEYCQLQVWVNTDTEHRLLAGKMVKVLDQAERHHVLPHTDLDLQFEYEAPCITQFTVNDWTVSDDRIELTLAAKHTDCLAKDVCLPSLPMLAGSPAEPCCGSSCGCA